MPIGLGDDGHAPSLILDQAAYDGRSERWMVDVGITAEQDYVDVVPSAELHFAFCCRKPVGELQLFQFSVLFLLFQSM